MPEPIIPLPAPDDGWDEPLGFDIEAVTAAGILEMSVEQVRHDAPYMHEWYRAALEVVGGLSEDDPDVMPTWMAAAIAEVLAREEDEEA